MHPKCLIEIISNIHSAYDKYVHEGEKQSLFHRDEDSLKFLNYINSHMSDPLSIEKYTPNLINISTGSVALSEVSNSILSAISLGTDGVFGF